MAAPLAPSAPILESSQDTGISSSDGITNLASPLTFTGTAPAGDTVILYSGGMQIGSGTATAGGSYSVTSTSGLAPGTYTITAKDTDSFGNTSSASSSSQLVIDTTPPRDSFSVASGPVGQLTLDFSEPVYNLTLGALSLNSNGGSNLLPGSGATLAAVNPNSAGGSATWILGNLSALTTAGGSYVAQLTAVGSGVTDLAGNPLAGNASTSFAVSGLSTPATPATPATFVTSVTLVAPSAPVLLPAEDTGISSSEAVTNLTTALIFSGTAPAGNTVTLYSGGTPVGSGTATAGGTYSIATTSGFSPGTYTITATDTNSSNQTSAASSATTLVIDTTVPTPSFGSVSSPVSQLTINFNEPVYNLPLSALSLSLNGSTNLITPGSGAMVAAVNPDSSGGSATWILGGLTNLTKSNGSYTVTLTAAGSGVTDLAGNPLASNSSTTFNLSDQVDPPIPSAPNLISADDTGISHTDDVTDLTTQLTFTGTVSTNTPGDSVTLYSDGLRIGMGVVTGGTYTITTNTGFAPGSYSVTAVSADSSGDTSSPSQATTLVIVTAHPQNYEISVSPSPITGPNSAPNL